MSQQPKRHLWSHKNIIAVLHDACMAGISFVAALWLRLGNDELSKIWDNIIPIGLPLFMLLCVAVFMLMRQYRGIWRYASIQDIVTICRSATLAILIFLPLLFLINRLDGYPRSALMINWMLLIALLATPRVFYRMLRDRNMHLLLGNRFNWLFPNDDRQQVILMGLNDQAEGFLRQTMRYECTPYRVIAIVDNDPRRQGRHVHGVKVIGRSHEMEKIMRKLRAKGYDPQMLVLDTSDRTASDKKSLLSLAESHGMSMAQLPALDALDAASAMPRLAPIAIEELLGRPQVTVNWQPVTHMLAGKCVMVTGAGGTIGGELARRIATLNPAHLILLDHSEFGLYNITQELSDPTPSFTLTSLLADVRDSHSMKQHCLTHKPNYIFHAAAIKHVPIAESNPTEAVLTNIIGTRNMADAARESGAAAMVMISTDKAVNPSSLMGATKRAAELYCQALGEDPTINLSTRFMTVRFGNVLGSTGSVVPLFRRQLERGGPLTITDAGMVRYFMTVQEAVQLVLSATHAGTISDTSGQIYVLDMGDPVRIHDLAEKMIRLYGLRPDKDIEIRTIGVRPGEKLYEELFYPEEAPSATSHAGILLAKQKPIAPRTIRRTVDNLERAALAHDLPKLLQELSIIVPEYAATTIAPKKQKRA